MKFAYADPPYLGCGELYAKLHPAALDWNDPQTHADLIARLNSEFCDGWALSCSSPSLAVLLPLCGRDVRVAAWIKPFAFFKTYVGVAYAWEPVIFRGGRKRLRTEDTVRDWVSANVTLKTDCPGAKPRAFCRWIFELLNAQPGDEFVDLFPGSNAVGAAWADYVGERSPLPELPLMLPSNASATRN